MSSSQNKPLFKFLILILALLLLWFLGIHFRVDRLDLLRFFAKFPLFYAGLIFIILYCLVTFFLWFSKDVFRFTAAILFGPYLSTLFVWLAEIINALILFHFSRYLGRSFIENSLSAKYKNLDQRLSKINFFWLFMFRAAPLIPFRFLDLAMGLTRISFRKYLSVVVLGSPLRIFWVQYVLWGVGESLFSRPQALVEYLLRNNILFAFSLIYLILVILVAFKMRFKD